MPPLQAGEPAKLLVMDDNRITVYQFPNVQVEGNDADNPNGFPYIDFSRLDGKIEDIFKLDEVATYPLPKELDTKLGFQVIYSRENRLYLFTGPMGDNKLFIISEDGKQEMIAFKNFIQRPNVGPSKTEEILVATGSPVGLFISLFLFDGDPGRGRLGLLATGSLIGLMIGLVLTYAAARRRGSTSSERFFGLRVYSS